MIAVARSGGVPEVDDGAVQELIHHAAGRPFDGLKVLGRQVSQAGPEPLQLGRPDRLGLALQGGDGGADLLGAEPDEEPVHLFLDDRLDPLHFRLAHGQALFNHGL